VEPNVLTYPNPDVRVYLPPGNPANEWHPLPVDYSKLTRDGQRLARVGLCRRQATPKEVVQAWSFFRNYYLLNGGAFYKDFAQSPPVHYKMVYDSAAFARNLTGAPRGLGKSTIKVKEIPLLDLFTRPGWHDAVCLGTDKDVEDRFEDIMEQIDDNDLLINDFGKLRPPKGIGSWNKHNLKLANGSRLRGLSVDGKKRGQRPDRFLLDDPEDDRSSKLSADRIRREMERLVFKVILPMLEMGCGCDWTGTIINHFSFLYYALYGGDPRFEYWNKSVYGAGLIPDETGECHLIWSNRPGWDRAGLERTRREMGSANYLAEKENRPTTEEERIIRRHEDDYYTISGDWQQAPRASEAVISYVHYDPRTNERSVRSERLDKFLETLYVLLLVDYASTVGPLSDYSAVHALGIDRDNTMWSLDLWAGKAREAAIGNIAFDMGAKWGARILASESDTVINSARERVYMTPHGLGWHPGVVKVTYPRGADKPNRFAGLEWRFNNHRIKHPKDRLSNPAYKMLFEQQDDFTMDLALLQHDDCFDTETMVSYVLHGQGAPAIAPEAEKPYCPYRPSGLPATGGRNSSDIPMEEVDRMIDGYYAGGYNESESLEEEGVSLSDIPSVGVGPYPSDDGGMLGRLARRGQGASGVRQSTQ